MTQGEKCKNCGLYFRQHGPYNQCPIGSTFFERVDSPISAAADLKAARLETVTKCLLAGLIYLDNPQNADLVYHGGLDGFIATIEKIKEEIENENH